MIFRTTADSKLLLSMMAFLVSAVHCVHKIKSATSDGDSVLSCGPASRLLIRTAHYWSPPSSNSTPSQSHCRSPACQSGESPDLAPDDVLKIYRHCQLHRHHCDVSDAGVDRPFNVTYFCLAEPLVDPCSNTISQDSANHTAMFFNYSRHSTDLQVTCECAITMDAPDINNTLYIRAMNLFDPDRQHGPRVSISSDQWHRPWRFSRQQSPVEWQLRMKGNSSAVVGLLFERLHGISFGHLWIEFLGQAMQVSCNFTSKPGPHVPDVVIPESTTKIESGWTMMAVTQTESDWTMVDVIGASGGGVLLLIVVMVVVLTCLHHRHSSGKYDNDKGAANEMTDIPLGVYCTISEVNDASTAHSANDSRGPGPPPMNDERRSVNDNNLPSRPLSDTCRPEEEGGQHGMEIAQGHNEESTAQNLAERNQWSECSGAGRPVRPSCGDYESLCHRPKQTPNAQQTSEHVIYDHTEPFRMSDDNDEQFHHLEHGNRDRSFVIDNVYDTATHKKAS